MTAQRTLKSSATLKGRGLHTGDECRVTLFPSAPNTGVVFVTKQGEILASIGNVEDTRRGTTLRSGEAEVHTVEHLLGALAGTGVDNARIEIDGPEVPAGDGSALPFVELIESSGTEELPVEARTVCPQEPIWVADGDKHLVVIPADRFRISSLIAFSHAMIGEQAISLVIDPQMFKEEIAPARTFCTENEISTILSQGLGKGGTKDNVVVVYDDNYSVPLRFRDEFVRHKVLDLIGDLSLIGGRLLADVTAIKSSHTLNIATADKILRSGAVWRQGG